MQLSFGSFRLATNSLTGNWKPGGERIPHPHHLLFYGESKKPNEGQLTPPPNFTKLGKVGLILLVHL